MYNFEKIQIKREFKSLKDINIRQELNKKYQYFPLAPIYGLIGVGAKNFEDIKVIIESGNISRVRNMGPKRVELTKVLIKKYEEEALLYKCDYCNDYIESLHKIRINNNTDAIINLCHTCYESWSE